MTMTDSKINPADLGSLHRQMNRALFVSWINADLINRCSNDVRKSILFYDEDRDFIYATRNEIDEELWAKLVAASPIRYWSQGA